MYLKLLASDFQNNQLVCFHEFQGKILATTQWISKQILWQEKFKIKILYPENSPPGQFAPDNSPLIFKQLAPHSFIHYRAKQATKYVNPSLNVIQIILHSFIHFRTKYSLFFYPLPGLKIGSELPGANCPGGELSDILRKLLQITKILFSD